MDVATEAFKPFLLRKDEIGALAAALVEMNKDVSGKCKAIEKIAQGRTDIKLPSLDDSVSQAIIDIKKALETRAEVANSIAAGQYNVRVHVKSKNDALGNAMNSMIKSLVKNQQANQSAIEKYKTELAGTNKVLDEISRVATLLKGGNLEIRFNPDNAHGKTKQALNEFNAAIDAILAPVNEAMSVLENISNGNLSAEVVGNYFGEHEQMKKVLNTTLGALNDLIGKVANSVNQVLNGSQQVASSSQSLSDDATKQASSMEEVTASMTQMGSQTKQNAENAAQANQFATAARNAASEGDAQMQQMLGAMDEINEASDNIAKIIKVIDEIAFQTNLLALNAAVEAARAGVHGKGFAVVAEEVRNLAQRSAKAARETTELIGGSVKKVENGTGIAQKTAQALSEIVDGVTKVTNLIGEIATASNEQALGISQVNQSLTQIDEVTQSNTANAEQSASAAEELSSQAEHLKLMLSKFQLRSGSAISMTMKKKQPVVKIIDRPEEEWSKMASLRDDGFIALDDDEFLEF